jgi:hypothetical protein
MGRAIREELAEDLEFDSGRHAGTPLQKRANVITACNTNASDGIFGPKEFHRCYEDKRGELSVVTRDIPIKVSKAGKKMSWDTK